MSKVKAKHEVELLELRNDLQRYVDKIEQYESRFQQLSNQLHAKNEQHLHLLKENEIMKSKMRTLENHTAFPSMKPAQLGVPTSFMDKIRGKSKKTVVKKNIPESFRNRNCLSTAASGTFKMEDEPDEVYNENFLEDLKTGRFSINGRESLSREEIERRNSMVPPHLRSSYTAQYQNQNIIDDSMFKVNCG